MRPGKIRDYNCPMTLDETEKLLNSGRYAEVLREALREQKTADQERRVADFVRWSLLALQACRYVGRTNEGLSHAYNALETSRTVNDPVLRCQAHHGQAVAFKCARDYEESLAQLKSAIEVLP